MSGLLDFTDLFFAIVPVFLIMGAGGLARKLEWITNAGEKTLLKLVVNILYPSFLFWMVSRNESLRTEGLIISAVLTGFIFVVIGYAVFYGIGPLFGIKDNAERRTFSFTGGIYNYGYFAIPVCEPLFGLDTTGVLLVISVGVELAMWSLGVLIVSGEFNRNSLKRIISPPLVAILFAIPVNLLGLTDVIPEFASKSLDLFGRCAIPIGLMMIGATMWDLMSREPVFTRPSVAIGACVTRLAILPLILVSAYLVIPAPLPLREAALVHAVMPCGVFPVVLTSVYGGRTDIALRTVIPTCLLSLLTIPLWIQLGLAWNGWN
ncbi:AEC family transporter [Cerasicoccus frondis]|uniref:AEC family transporter n=1 Tax=Cerasicoccus frondis TaxID=490090 RepID=UPI002852C6EE|nr:AEC family transporter [Cerasicoccus frondis]